MGSEDKKERYSPGAWKLKVKRSRFNEAVDLLSGLVEEARFRISKDGITVLEVDTSHVAMLHMELPKSLFESFEVETPGKYDVDLDKLKDVMKIVPDDEELSLAHVLLPPSSQEDEPEPRLLSEYFGIKRTDAFYSEGHDRKIPDFETLATVRIPTVEFLRMLRAAETVTDHIALEVGPGPNLSIEADGDITEITSSWSFPKEGKGLRFPAEDEEKVRSCFPLDYLMTILKKVKWYLLTLEIGNEMPIRISFDLADGAGKCAYLVAPRMEHE